MAIVVNQPTACTSNAMIFGREKSLLYSFSNSKFVTPKEHVVLHSKLITSRFQETESYLKETFVWALRCISTATQKEIGYCDNLSFVTCGECVFCFRDFTAKEQRFEAANRTQLDILDTKLFPRNTMVHDDM